MSSDADEEVIDILDEMKSSRMITESITYGKTKSFEIFIKNILWKFEYHRLCDLTISCSTGNNGTYWRVHSEHKIKLENAENGSIYSYFRSQYVFSDSLRWALPLEFISPSFKITIKITVLKVEGFSWSPSIGVEGLVNDEASSAVFLIKGRKIRINKQYLSTQSPVFDAMFNSQFAEKNKKEIPIKKRKYTSFVEFLRILHFRKTFVKADYVIFDILVTADFYQVQWVMDYCEDWLVKNELNRKTRPKDPAISKLLKAQKYKLNNYLLAICDSLKFPDRQDIKKDQDYGKLLESTLLAIDHTSH